MTETPSLANSIGILIGWIIFVVISLWVQWIIIRSAVISALKADRANRKQIQQKTHNSSEE